MKKAKVVATIAPGIYKLEDNSYRAVARAGKDLRQERRFPARTSVREMRSWLESTRSELRRQRLRPVRGMFADDVDRYLREAKNTVAFIKDREREIRAWLPLFGERQRHTIEAQEIKEQLREWRRSYAPHTCNLRRTALSHLFTTLDGPNAINPVREVPKFDEPKPTPKWLPYEVIERTFAMMSECRTKGRLMLIAYGGFRPSEVMRAQPEDVLPYLDLPEPFCFKRVGKRGVSVMVPLPREGVAAWRLLIALNGWGRFQQADINRDWKKAMVRAGEAQVTSAVKTNADSATVEKIRLMFKPVNCYRLRHSYSVRLLLACGNKEIVQKALGHAKIATTDVYTRMIVDPRLQDAVKRAFGT